MIDTLFLKVGQYGSLIMSSIHTVFVRLFSKRTTIGGVLCCIIEVTSIITQKKEKSLLASIAQSDVAKEVFM